LKSAKIFLSIFPEDREEEIRKTLKTKTAELQKYIGSRLKTKFTPRLEFEKEILK
jgi:ribosome-binding factor A